MVVDNSALQIKTYVNGTLTSSYSFPSGQAGPYINVNTFNVGDIGSGYNIGYFNGLIDDVRIYNRALSAAEISAMYNGGK